MLIGQLANRLLTQPSSCDRVGVVTLYPQVGERGEMLGSVRGPVTSAHGRPAVRTIPGVRQSIGSLTSSFRHGHRRCGRRREERRHARVR